MSSCSTFSLSLSLSLPPSTAPHHAPRSYDVGVSHRILLLAPGLGSQSHVQPRQRPPHLSRLRSLRRRVASQFRIGHTTVPRVLPGRRQSHPTADGRHVPDLGTRRSIQLSLRSLDPSARSMDHLDGGGRLSGPGSRIRLSRSRRRRRPPTRRPPPSRRRSIVVVVDLELAVAIVDLDRRSDCLVPGTGRPVDLG